MAVKHASNNRSANFETAAVQRLRTFDRFEYEVFVFNILTRFLVFVSSSSRNKGFGGFIRFTTSKWTSHGHRTAEIERCNCTSSRVLKDVHGLSPRDSHIFTSPSLSLKTVLCWTTTCQKRS